MAEPKTKPSKASVVAFIKSVDPARHADCETIIALLQRMTKSPPQMWGTSIVGFGIYHYHYASGREGDWPRIGFSPRKQNLTLYIMNGFDGEPELMAALGKYKTGKSCLYINSLTDINLKVLEKLVKASLKYMNAKYPV